MTQWMPSSEKQTAGSAAHFFQSSSHAGRAASPAASIGAKAVRHRVMRRLDALYANYGFVSHVGYITPAHNEAVRSFGPSELHRRSFQARCYAAVEAA